MNGQAERLPLIGERVGDEVIIPPPGSCGAAAERVEKAGADYRCLDWFLCLKKYPGK